MSQDNNRQNNEQRGPWRWILGAAGAGAALAGGVAYFLMKSRDDAQAQNVNAQSAGNIAHQRTLTISSILGNLRISTGNKFSSDKLVPNAAVPVNPQITNLNSLLSDIYVRFIQLKDDDFQLHYKVFHTIFNGLHQTMKTIDPYYNKYASDVKFAGSHFDKLRIKRADEFDMDIVVSLPLNYQVDRLEPLESDIVVEASGAGFVHLRMGRQFRNLPLRDGAQWLVNRAAFQWGDDAGFLLRSHFISWFKGVVDRALSRQPTFVVEGVSYSVRRSESGPAVTLHVGNSRGFRLDVDLVPALKLPEQRWPVSPHYRTIPPACSRGHWLLVPKPDKRAGALEQGRTWRIALHDQERQLLNNLYNCKQIIRLVKKLRDAQEMHKIASYYVKTLFLWEVVERTDRQYWRRGPAELFRDMVRRLHRALLLGDIPYFWNRHNNLIAGVNRPTLDGYAAKLQNLLDILEEPAQYKRVAKFLLSREEFDYYNRFLNI